MAIQQNWDNSRLGDYLLYDYWRPYNGWCVLAGFDYEAASVKNIRYNRDVTLDPFIISPPGGFNPPLEHGIESEAELKKIEKNVDRLSDFWLSGDKDDDEGESPKYFIEWALSKRFRPDWLNWAIENKLYTPGEPTSEAITQPLIVEQPLSSTVHHSDKLQILKQAANRFWANADPCDSGTHPRARDVEAWLQEKGFVKTLAKSASTIIRPKWAIVGRRKDE